MPEALEARRVLTSYLVTTADDVVALDGLISLREAIEAASTNVAVGDAVAGQDQSTATDVISFDAAITAITLASPLSVSDSVVIDGGSGVTLTGSGGHHLLTIDSGASSSSIDQMVFRGGDGGTDGGGAIRIAAGVSVAISDSVFDDNQADSGGAIFNDGGDLTVQSVAFTDNVAGGTSGSGGAILTTGGTVTVLDGTLTGNLANRAGGAIEITGGDIVIANSSFGTVANPNVAGPSGSAAPGNGGALHVTGSAGVSVSDSQFIGNVAASEGGALWNGTGVMRVVSSTFADNEAQGDDADNGGGALFNAGGILAVGSSTLTDNFASGASGSGGGIFNDAGGTLQVSGTSLSGNVANRAGGGIEDNSGAGTLMRLVGVTMTGNSAGVDLGNGLTPTASPGNGGGIHITGPGDAFISQSSFVSNFAASEGGGLWNGTGLMRVVRSTIQANGASGDGADNGGGGVFNAGGRVELIRSNVLSNVANGTLGSGGGILNDVGGTLLSRDTSINGNIAVRAGGGIEDNSGNPSAITIVRGELNENVANGDGAAPGNGGALHVTGPGGVRLFDAAVMDNTAALEGGGFWNGSGTMSIVRGTFAGNEADGDAADDGGGNLFNLSGDLIVSGSTIRDGLALGTAGSGGGILSLAGTVSLRDTDVTGNRANRAGGGIEIASNDARALTMIGGSLQTNQAGLGTGTVAAPGNGGGVHVTGGGNTFFQSVTVSANEAAREGGGLWNDTGVMTVLGTTLSNNIAEGDAADDGGGGIFNNGGSVRVVRSTLSGNQANGSAGSGGGIFHLAGSLLVRDSSLTMNSAVRAGGGIEDVSGSASPLNIIRSDLSGNAAVGGTAPGNGGALHVTGDGDVRIFDSNINNNTAATEGGGLWNGTGPMSVLRSTISGNVASGADADDGGGGIFNLGGRVGIDPSTTISNNVADGAAGSGGGVLSVGGSVSILGATLSGNVASRAGGGIEIAGTTTGLRLAGTTLTGNIAGSDATSGTVAAPGNGGGLHVTGNIDVDISGATVSNNVADSEGGGLWNGSGVMVVEDSVITSNRADGDDADNGGGGIFNAGGDVVVIGGSITGNTALGTAGSGGGVFNDAAGSLGMVRTIVANNTANRAGGGIEDNSGSGTVRLIGVRLTNNSAGVDIGSGATASPGNGGGMHVTGGGTTFISQSDVRDNVAASEGGGLWNGSGLMRVTRSTVATNTASGDAADNGGGGVFNAGGRLELVRSIVDGNSADGTAGSGGGVFSDAGGSFLSRDSQIINNDAVRAGGGIEDNTGSANAITLVRTVLSSNNANGGTAPGNGGGLHITGSGGARLFDSTVNDNFAAREGGGLWNGSGSMVVVRTGLEANEADGPDIDDGGGAIFNNGGMLFVGDSTFTDNVATTSGEAILSVGGTVSIDGSTLDDDVNGTSAQVFMLDAFGDLAGNTFVGGGVDVIAATAAAAATTFTVDASGVTYGGSTLTISPAIRSLTVIGGDAADTFNVVPTTNTSLRIVGGDPDAAPGDTLNLDDTGFTRDGTTVSGDSGLLTYTDAADVAFAEIETFVRTP